ncbi:MULTISPECIES: two-component system response regulator NarL [unclassified Pseudoalteromonas]|uniref:two-component system response regulator NarL n=1 Tax=unclassified Pseudoalteromonas TaxID=194690 RepID=UPI000C5F8E2D|nr:MULTISPECIES: two-component system response regulator NarL [unclassified Pseudoalteromonas]MAB62050.1 two-component system response regulator NarL [Pseudoalteromonas sp.]MCH2087037.1 two-component system response regulator NarL [Pseudoalteromonas sp.]NHH88803.1 Nitrate/nitrite response regulator protein NarL [Pseudoalteromonas sp. MB47]NRA81061.1 two-component system response regulator NarL [Pseudoalteromonas sp.]
MSVSESTVLLIDDHPLLRKGLRQLIELEDELTIIAEASNGKEGLALAVEHDPDLIILDLNMQGMDGLETLKAMRLQDVTARIIMLTVSDNDEDVLTAISYGADGYLLKDMDPEEILEKMKQAAVGKMVLSEKLTDILAQAIRKPDVSQKANLINTLTSREFEILKLIAKGLSNKLIARELDISDGTVKVHVKHLLKKLDLRSRVEAAVWMINQQKGS